MNSYLLIVWLQVGITTAGGALLIALWMGIQKRFRGQLREISSGNTRRKDLGLVFLALASFIWAIMGLWSYAGYTGIANETGLRLGFSVFSTLNNLALLLAIYYMRGAPAFLHKNPRNVAVVAAVVLLLSIGVSALLSYQATYEASNYVAESYTPNNYELDLIQDYPASRYNWDVLWLGIPDMILSFLLIGLLAFSIFRTFILMGQRVFAAMAATVFLGGILAQIPSGFPNAPFLTQEEVMVGLRLGSKIGTIFIFLVLAASWMMELGSMERPKNLKIAFPDRENTVRLTIPKKDIRDQELRLRPKQYSVLLRFAVRKLGSQDKTLIRVGKGGEFEQTYLSRMISDLNSELKKAGINGPSSLERTDLLNFVGQGLYELRVQKENIEVHEGVLQRFVQSLEGGYSPDNEPYRVIVANCS